MVSRPHALVVTRRETESRSHDVKTRVTNYVSRAASVGHVPVAAATGLEQSRRHTMNRSRLLALLAVAAVVVAIAGVYLVASTDLASSTQTDRLNETRTARLIHADVNAERTDRGLASLTYDRHLASIADTHSQTMVSRGQLVGPSTPRTVLDRYRQAGYQCGRPPNGTIPETVGRTQVYTAVTTHRGTEYFNSERELARGIVNMWLHTPSQRERLLHSGWHFDGVAVVIRPDDTVYVTADFC